MTCERVNGVWTMGYDGSTMDSFELRIIDFAFRAVNWFLRWEGLCIDLCGLLFRFGFLTCRNLDGVFELGELFSHPTHIAALMIGRCALVDPSMK